MRHFTDEVLRETAAETEIGQRIYDNWLAFRDRMKRHAPFSELGYLNNRAGAA